MCKDGCKYEALTTKTEGGTREKNGLKDPQGIFCFAFTILQWDHTLFQNCTSLCYCSVLSVEHVYILIKTKCDNTVYLKAFLIHASRFCFFTAFVLIEKYIWVAE